MTKIRAVDGVMIIARSQTQPMNRTNKYRPLIAGKARDPGRFFKKLKHEPPATIDLVLDALEPAYAKHIACPNPFPSSYAHIGGGYTTTNSNDFEVEFTWAAVCLSRFSADINEFIKIHTDFERAVLLAQYNDAYQHLSRAQDRFGFSLWTLECNLLLGELTAGLKGNRAYLQQLKDNASPTVRLFGDYFSRRVEKNFSYENYFSWTLQQFDLYRGTPRSFLEWVLFRADGRTGRFLEFPGYILWREVELPLVDRYLAFVKIAQLVLVKNTRQHNRPIVAALTHTAERIADPRLQVLASLVTPGRPLSPNSERDMFMAAIDAYTVGDYGGACKIMEGTLKQFPGSFEQYELYAHSLIHGDLPFESSFLPEESLAGELLSATCTIVGKGASTEDALQTVSKLSAMLDGFSFSMKLDAFVRLQSRTGASSSSQEGNVYSCMLTPRLSVSFANTNDALLYLSCLDEMYPNSSAIAIHRSAKDGSLLTVNIPQSRKDKYRAFGLLGQRDYASAAAAFEKLLLGAQNAPQHEDALAGLFASYCHSRRFDDCVCLVVDTYLGKWPSSLIRLDLNQVDVEEISEEARTEIGWPLFCYIADVHGQPLKESKAIYEAYDDFLTARAIRLPSELRDKLNGYALSKLICFLWSICTPEIMSNAIAFKTSDALEAERIHLCQWLLELDPGNTERYAAEIARLSQQAAIRRALHGLSTSKVHIDTIGIRRSLPRSFRDRYERYVRLSDLRKNLRVVLGEAALRELLEDNELDADMPKVMVVTDASLQQFIELFTDLRDRFISSNEHGLDSYLSVRIRHGTLSGQLRAQFEKHNLVTRKKGTHYLPNTAWDHVWFALLGFDGEEREQAMEILGDFSVEVDQIIEEVKTQWIQIKGEANQLQGLFDYEYSQKDFMALCTRVRVPKSYDTFLDAFFAELWSRTQQNLNKVVDAIQGPLKTKFAQALQDLAKRLARIDPRLAHSPISDAINRCGTELQNELEVIAGWFKGAEEASLPSFDFELLFEANIATIKNIYPQQRIAILPKVSTDVVFAGRYFAPFNDIMLILLQNAIRHSGIDEIAIEMRASPAGGEHLQVQVVNTLNPSADLEKVNDLAQSAIRSMDPTSSSPAIRMEGGTGFAKLRKLFNTDLGIKEVVINAGVVNGPAFEVTMRFNSKELQDEDSDRRGRS